MITARGDVASSRGNKKKAGAAGIFPLGYGETEGEFGWMYLRSEPARG
jgi:hypothetical protein